jgi:hypothetical protein
MRLPIADSVGHARRARPSLITVTSVARSSSAAVKARPASIGMPIVAK